MGLNVSHNAWQGAYSNFNRFRSLIAKELGHSLEAFDGFGGYLKMETVLKDEPLVILLDHSDCDGYIKWQDCPALANRLREIEKVKPYNDETIWFKEKLLQFAEGCEKAYSLKEDLEFR